MKYCEETEQYISVIKSQMTKLGVLEEADIENLKLLKTQIELYYRAIKELDEKGFTTLDKLNRTVTNPAFAIQRSAMTNIISLMRELSLSARQRRMLVKDEMTDEKDPLDEFLYDMRKDKS